MKEQREQDEPCVNYSISTPPSMRDKVDRIADDEHRSRSSCIQEAITTWLEKK